MDGIKGLGSAVDLKPHKPDRDLNPLSSGPVSGLNKAQVLYVSSQKELSERQSDR